ncbi:MAG: 16S rRNA (cytidine(1402)-2'-O)-methyltransferase [Gammaproteobacteria bacterium]|nr:16S rRNA (cytidine(1402)-2'-O)-methyltransferase [Gammaproteobacteria bacterium]MBU1447914.1 16S rRNA (cytidine(1402)-2'-O)-methyltransferase [Gammaproteobacteria bacterium]MDD5470716.1 16S rRNA (cytidine(1402)-2'-O)-methyltransferase [Sideroxydans sp.]
MHSKTNQRIECALYVVATPIGNLSDITLRALDILNGVDVVAAEDTRNTRHLLQHHGLSDAKLLAVHQHNERGSANKVIALLQEGKSVALVTDAGTPAVSDPGAVLVEAVREAGLRVIPIPGASAVITALSASGLANPHFMFYGFLPNKSGARRATLQALANQTCTLVFYEAPHRILECAADLQEVFGGEREIVFAREITKLFESIHRCKLGDAMDWLNSDANNQRGEFVLLVSGAPERTEALDADAERVLTLLLNELPLKQAVQLAVQITGQNKNALYQKALALKSA